MFACRNGIHFLRSRILLATILLFVGDISNCDAAYTPPNVKVEPLHPRGLRLSIPDEQGITLVAYHVKFNEDFFSLEAGTIAVDIIKARDGRWTYQDRTTQLKRDDVIYYWVHVVYEGLGYNLLNQEYRVTRFYNSDGTLVTESDVGEGAVCAIPSETKKINQNGEWQNTCPGQLIFQDNFDNINENQWKIIEQFSDSPDYEFVVYKNSEENINVQSGHLRIAPTYLEDKYGTGYVRRGELDLDKCTGIPGSSDCKRVGYGLYILPPIISARINTKGNFAFLYGRIEVRAKLPRGDWIYPLISLEPLNDDTQHGYTPPQMRIASSSGNPVLTSIEGTDLSGHILWAGRLLPSSKTSGENPNSARQLLPRRRSSNLWSSDYHIYELEWRNDRILVKVDGVSYGEHKSATPFNKPYYINIGLAVGGRGEFPDHCRSDNYVKPWKNVGSKALLDFHEKRDNWTRTWEGDATNLKIDYVKVWAL